MHNQEQSIDALGAVVTQALRLDAQDQRRLADLMNRMTGASGSAPQEHPPGTSGTDSEPVSVQEWVQSLGDLVPWQRLQLIEDALQKTEAGTTENLELEKSRRALLDENPTLNLRMAVQRAAADHPGWVLVGLCGLLLAAGTLGHRLFRLVF